MNEELISDEGNDQPSGKVGGVQSGGEDIARALTILMEALGAPEAALFNIIERSIPQERRRRWGDGIGDDNRSFQVDFADAFAEVVDNELITDLAIQFVWTIMVVCGFKDDEFDQEVFWDLLENAVFSVNNAHERSGDDRGILVRFFDEIMNAGARYKQSGMTDKLLESMRDSNYREIGMGLTEAEAEWARRVPWNDQLRWFERSRVPPNNVNYETVRRGLQTYSREALLGVEP
jgi:hypothetical protein